jgi:predicted GNAT family N-acyltransferase
VSTEFRVRSADWERDADALQHLRRTIFVVEQQVSESLEWDGVDAECIHALVEDAAGRPIGCARLLPDGHIGRVAVLASHRGLGVGDALMRYMIALAASLGHDRVMVNAQTHAMRFYERLGFAATGEEYDDAGIPHRTMVLDL